MRKILNEELGRLSVEEYKLAEKHSIVLILDNVRSMQNVGSAFRTADAFRIEKIELCGITAQPPHRDITRSALGATDTVEWSYHENTLTVVKEYQTKGYQIISIEQVEGATSLEKVTWNKGDKIAIVFGHEVKGVQQSVVDRSDSSIEIPQFGSKHSFNISVSIGIVLWQMISKSI